MIDNIPPQTQDNRGESEDLSSSNTSKQDLEDDEFKYFDAILKSRIVESLLNSKGYSIRGREEVRAYDGPYLSQETGAVTDFFPKIERGSTISNTWYTSAYIVTERQNFKASFNNPMLVSTHYGEWKANVSKKFFKEESERNHGFGIGKSNAEKECKFALRSLSFMLEIEDKPVIASFEYGFVAKWREKDIEEYLRLIISERGKSGRFEMVKMIDDVPSEVMTIEQFKKISEYSKGAIDKAIKRREEEEKKRF